LDTWSVLPGGSRCSHPYHRFGTRHQTHKLRLDVVELFTPSRGFLGREAHEEDGVGPEAALGDAAGGRLRVGVDLRELRARDDGGVA
jgi:hypothetical protein